MVVAQICFIYFCFNLLKPKTYKNQQVCSEERVLHKLVQTTHLARLDFFSGLSVSLSNKWTYTER